MIRNYAQFYLINVGYFDTMSCHYYNPKQPLPGACAWTKMRLGWIEPYLWMSFSLSLLRPCQCP